MGAIAGDTTGFSHDRCYLSSTGNCGTQITKEHFISRNILERLAKPKLKINAPHFFGKPSVEIGVDSFSAKVLCDKHNSALSKLDDVAGVAFGLIEELSARLATISNEPGAGKSFYVSSGIDIERWMIKVFCGLVAAGKIRGISGLHVSVSDLWAGQLDSLLGRSTLPEPLGMYTHTFVGQQRTPGSFSFSTIQLTDGSGEVGGVMLSLGLMSLVLVTSPRFSVTFTEPNWYRHPGLLFNVKHGGSRAAYLLTY